MRLGKKKQAAVYKAIHDAVMAARIVLNLEGVSAAQDREIAQLETTIWRGIVTALDICEQDR